MVRSKKNIFTVLCVLSLTIFLFGACDADKSSSADGGVIDTGERDSATPADTSSDVVQSDTTTPLACGDGVLDDGEACDSAITSGDGVCPVGCDNDGLEACVIVTLEGDAASCSAVCRSTPVGCVNDDGCCTASCDDTNDNDCVVGSFCGDGVVDPGERCDGDCPTSCSGPDMCSVYRLEGDAASCNVRCVSDPVACMSDDGCCPAGCTGVVDSDCPVWACDPSFPVEQGDYLFAEGLSSAGLRIELEDFVNDHFSLGYDDARDAIYDYLDVHSDMIECVYTGRLVAPDGTRTPSGFNTEHSWPQGEFNGEEPMRSDLHHIFPSDGTANNTRGNYDFGWTDCDQNNSCDWSDGGSRLGSARSGNGLAFTVRESRRGDIARAHFYFAIRYNMSIPAEEEAALREWHCQDPPDDLERERLQLISVRQYNRNPFIDRPDFVDRINDF